MDEFFSDPSIMELAEAHAAEAAELEGSEAERILRSYKRVRQDLRDRLDSIRPGTFTRQRMASTLVQVDAALKAMGEGLLEGMNAAGQAAAELGINHLIEEIETWDRHFTGAVSPINLDVVKAATETNKLLINTKKSSLKSYSESVRNRIAQGLGDGVIAGDSTPNIMDQIGKTFLGEQWKLERIVRTEVMGIYSRGKLRGMNDAQDDVPDLMKTVWNPMDSRTADDSKYVERRVEEGDSNLIVPLDEYFQYTWKKQKRRYLVPPDRPNDRSILIPARSAWLTANKK